MATVTKPIALDESFNTTENTSRNIADVLSEGIGDLISAVSRISGQTTYDELEKLNDVDISNVSNGQVIKYNSTTQKWENANESGGSGGGGILPHLIIHSDTGSTVTAVKGTKTITATETSAGIFECDVTEYGDWTVNGVVDGLAAHTTLPVTYVRIYEVNFIIGATVTPTNDVTLLLECAGIYDSEITTINELLADSTALTAVISSNNAIDYLVRSTTFASDVTADSTAMSYIGLNNYASDTLLGDSTWLNAICNSTYFESVLNVKVPTMTSNTTPSGECISSGNYSGSYPNYYAFDGNSSTFWNSQVGNLPHWIGYDFNSPTKIIVCKFQLSNALARTNYLQGWDGNSWVDINNIDNDTTENATYTLITNSDIAYSKYRIKLNSGNYPSDKVESVFREINFYGREDV